MSIKKSKTNKNDIPDFIFTFRYSRLVVDFVDGIFNLSEKSHIQNIVNTISEYIVIDKSYVDFSENKHQKVFIEESEWKELCKLVYTIKLNNKKNKKISKKDLEKYKLITLILYSSMIENYLYGILLDFGYDIEYINLSLAENTFFKSEIEIDNIHAWKYYPGPWQTW